MLIHKSFNRNLDQLVRPELHILQKSLSAFYICGYTGFVLALFLSATLVFFQGLSLWVMAGLGVSAIFTFLMLATITKIITGEERLVFYHHEIAVITVATLMLLWWRQPILPYLDVVALGIGLFLACTRIGCLMVGCCHGRPSSWGVCYQEAHASVGFTPYFVGVRLFPIQMVESLWVFCIILVGSVLLFGNYPPGSTLNWYIVAYGAGRFCFEFMRGDAERPYYWGFSQAQWISLLLMCAVVWAEKFGVLSFYSWHIGATVCIALTMLGVALLRNLQKTAKHKLLNPHHIKEVAEAVELVTNLATEETIAEQNPQLFTHIGCTSLGIQISASKIQRAASCVCHYAVSNKSRSLTIEGAKTLTELILQLKHPSDSNELIEGNHGVFHLLVHSRSAN